MSSYLESATLWGERSTMPGIPNRKISGAFYAEPHALMFLGERDGFWIAVALEQIKQCYAFSVDPGGIGAFFSWLLTLGVIEPHEWHILLTYYSSEHDQDMSVDFYVATSNGSLLAERRAVALAKSIWTLRSERLRSLRSQTAIRVRGE